LNKRELQQWDEDNKALDAHERAGQWRSLAIFYKTQCEELRRERDAAWRKFLDLSKDEQLAGAMEEVQRLCREVGRLTIEGGRDSVGRRKGKRNVASRIGSNDSSAE